MRALLGLETLRAQKPCALRWFLGRGKGKAFKNAIAARLDAPDADGKLDKI
jgi:hypothetical protein